jgi:hypothetical protein
MLEKVALVLLATTMGACAPATRMIMLDAPERQIRATASAATLVVGNVMNWKVVNLLDDKGRLIGQLTGRSSTVLRLPAGPMKLYVVPEKEASWGDRLEGTLAAGRVYYAEVSMRWGGVAVQVDSERLNPERWAKRARYAQDLAPVKIDKSRIGEVVEDLGDTAAILRVVDGTVAGFEPEWRRHRTFRDDDGEPGGAAAATEPTAAEQ